MARPCKLDAASKVMPGVRFVSALKNGGSFAKSYFLSCVKIGLRETRRKSSIFSFKVPKLEEVLHEMLALEASDVKFKKSHETIVLEACYVKIGGSLARNPRFHVDGRSRLRFIE